MALKEAVAKAVEEIRKASPTSAVAVREDGQGGAYVTIDPVSVGSLYQPQETWIGFRVTFQYPYADVYPHYVDGNLRRSDGGPVVREGIQGGQTFEGKPAYQISRRSNRLNPQRDTALSKLGKVLECMRHPK